VHCGWLEIGGVKMAKRAGKLYTVPELVEMGYAGRDLRLFLIKQHYRSPLPFGLDLLDEARTIRARLQNFVHFEMAERPDGPSDPRIGAGIEKARAAFRAALEDDLNVSEALAAIHGFVSSVNGLDPSAADAAAAVSFMRETDRVLGVLDPEPKKDSEDPEISARLAERERARQARDFTTADRIRDELLEQGIEILDTPRGPRWKRR